MLLDRIFNNSIQKPNKQAIVYKEKSLNYSDLWKEIINRASLIESIDQKTLLLTHRNELENLLNFLAGMVVKKVGVFGSKHLTDFQKETFKIENSAFILNEEFTITNPLANNLALKLPDVKTSDIFLGVLSSGTTASPKLILKDYQSWFTAFPFQSAVFGINEADRLFVLDSLGYSANLNSVLHLLWQGGTIVMTSLSSANSWSQQIGEQGITSIFMVPSHFRLLVSGGFENSKIKSVVSAGEKLDIDTAQKLMNINQIVCLTEYYGSAELGHITYHQNNEILENSLSVGKPFPGVKINFQNDQIFVDSPYISPDFRKVKTNFDLGYFIDKQLILMGRAGRMFNRRGLNVFAEEIENVVKKFPFIIEAAAVGILEIDNSHEILLAYTCTTGFQNNTNNDKIFTYLASHLQATKIPSRIQEFENLPRTDFGKIDFKAIARSFEAEIFA